MFFASGARLPLFPPMPWLCVCVCARVFTCASQVLVECLQMDLDRHQGGALLASDAFLGSRDRTGAALPDGMWILQTSMQHILRARDGAASPAAAKGRGQRLLESVVASLCQLVSVLCKALGKDAFAELIASHLPKSFRKCQGDLLMFCDVPTCDALRIAKSTIDRAEIEVSNRKTFMG